MISLRKREVLEFNRHDLADDEEDEEQIFRSEARASRAYKCFASRALDSQRRASAIYGIHHPSVQAGIGFMPLEAPRFLFLDLLILLHGAMFHF